MNRNRLLRACFGAIAALALLFLCWVYFGFSPVKHVLSTQEMASLITGTSWEEIGKTDTGDNTDPTAVKQGDMVQSGTIKVETAVLPEAFEAEQDLLFKTTHTRVEVMVADELVYRCGWEEGTPSFMKSPGTLWHVVDIPGDNAGKTLTIRLYPTYEDFYGNTLEVRYGSRGACVLDLASGFVWILVVNGIILFAGIVSLVLHWAMRNYEDEHERGSFLCVGFFSICIAVWSLCQCGCLQLFISDARVLYFVDFFSFFLFPVPFNLYLSTICRTRCKEGFQVLSGVYMVNMLIEMFIQVMGWLDIFEMLKATHVIMALNVVYVYFAFRHEIRKAQNEEARRFRLPLYLVMLFATAELIAYYARAFKQTSVFLPIGTIVFITMIIWIQMTRYHNKQLEQQKLQYYEKLANTDMLTEAWNRNAYENMLKKLEQQELALSNLSIIMFDVNNMKYINDNYGHEKGDESLKLCYRCICQAFGDAGKCYRIGGDEFVYITSYEMDMPEAIGRFQGIVEQIAKGLSYPFSVSVGYAQYDREKHERIKDTIRRSDEMMYENKRKLNT